MVPITGTTDCATIADSSAYLNNLVVLVKRSTQNFSPLAYKDNDGELTTFFRQEKIQLSKSLSNWIEFSIDKISTSFTDQVFYTDQLFQDVGIGTHTSIITYGMETSNSLSLPYTDFSEFTIQ